MKALLCCVVLTSWLITACSKKSECPPYNISKEELHGAWKDNRSTEDMLAGTRYDFTFQQDTAFTLILTQWNDAIDINCPYTPYQEYVKGTYQYSTSNNVLSVSGIYTDSLYNEKTSGCFSIGKFRRDYKVVRKCNTLELDEIGNQSHNHVIVLAK